jgi:hypothetical protein
MNTVTSLKRLTSTNQCEPGSEHMARLCCVVNIIVLELTGITRELEELVPMSVNITSLNLNSGPRIDKTAVYA